MSARRGAHQILALPADKSPTHTQIHVDLAIQPASRRVSYSMRDKHDTSAMGRHRCNHGTRCALCPSVPLRTPSRVLIPRGTRALSLLPVFLFLCLWLSKDFVLPSWFSVLVTRAAYFRFAGAAQQLSCRGLGLRLGAVQDSGAPDKIIIIERCALLRCILRIVLNMQVHYMCAPTVYKRALQATLVQSAVICWQIRTVCCSPLRADCFFVALIRGRGSRITMSTILML